MCKEEEGGRGKVCPALQTHTFSAFSHYYILFAFFFSPKLCHCIFNSARSARFHNILIVQSHFTHNGEIKKKKKKKKLIEQIWMQSAQILYFENTSVYTGKEDVSEKTAWPAQNRKKKKRRRDVEVRKIRLNRSKTSEKKKKTP